MFDPGGTKGRLHTYPFLGTCRALLSGEAMRAGAAGGDLHFLEDRLFGIQKTSGGVQAKYLRRIYIVVNRWLFEAARPALIMPCQDEGMPSRAARGDRKLGANGCRGASWSEQLEDKELRGAFGNEREDPRFLGTVCPSFFIYYSVVC